MSEVKSTGNPVTTETGFTFDAIKHTHTPWVKVGFAVDDYEGRDRFVQAIRANTFHLKAPDSRTFGSAANDSLTCYGTGRDPENEKCLFVSFNRRPTDDELRNIDEMLKGRLPVPDSRTVWLVELMEPGTKQSLGFYFTGKTDLGGYPITTGNPNKARQYSYIGAHAVVAAMLKSVSGEWAATEHMFIDQPYLGRAK